MRIGKEVLLQGCGGGECVNVCVSRYHGTTIVCIGRDGGPGTKISDKNVGPQDLSSSPGMNYDPVALHSCPIFGSNHSPDILFPGPPSHQNNHQSCHFVFITYLEMI